MQLKRPAWQPEGGTFSFLFLPQLLTAYTVDNPLSLLHIRIMQSSYLIHSAAPLPIVPQRPQVAIIDYMMLYKGS